MDKLNIGDNELTKSFSPLLAGTEICQYNIIEKIGAGGMGEVFLAEDTGLDRKVALKFLPSNVITKKGSYSARLYYISEKEDLLSLKKDLPQQLHNYLDPLLSIINKTDEKIFVEVRYPHQAELKTKGLAFEEVKQIW